MEDDDHIVDENYKGIFYNEEEPEERYYEHGAHFQYKDLFRRLEKIKSQQEQPQQTKQENHRITMENCILSEELLKKVAPQSHININLNNIYINNETKSRNVNIIKMNHSKSRNNAATNLNSNTYQIQLNHTIKPIIATKEKTLEHLKQSSASSNNNDLKEKQKENIYEGVNKFGKKIEIKLNKNGNKKFELTENMTQKEFSRKKIINQNSLQHIHINANSSTFNKFNKINNAIVKKPSVIFDQRKGAISNGISNYNRKIISSNNLSKNNNKTVIMNIFKAPLTTSVEKRYDTNNSKTIETRSISKNTSVLLKSPNMIHKSKNNQQSRNIPLIQAIANQSKHFTTKVDRTITPAKKPVSTSKINSLKNYNNNNFIKSNIEYSKPIDSKDNISKIKVNSSINNQDKTSQAKINKENKDKILNNSKTVGRILPINTKINHAILKTKSQANNIEVSSAFTFKQLNSSANKQETTSKKILDSKDKQNNQFLHSAVVKDIKPKLKANIIPTSIMSLFGTKTKKKA